MVLGNGAFERGQEQNTFLKRENGSLFQGTLTGLSILLCVFYILISIGVVWPGVTVFPDWFNDKTPAWWNGEFNIFFDSETGIDIDGLWIDMNEASNFCSWPCLDPQSYAEENDYPPTPPAVRPNPRPLPGFPSDFQPSGSQRFRKRADNGLGQQIGLSGRDLINPPYQIANAAGSLSNKTIDTELIHAGGYAEYDTHNLYGTSKLISLLLSVIPTEQQNSDERCFP
jgi:alpha-glucosidase